MPELTLRLRRDKDGKHEIMVDMSGEGDMLPHEHEQAHAENVEKIFGKGAIGKLQMDRPEDGSPVQTVTEPAQERQAQGQTG